MTEADVSDNYATAAEMVLNAGLPHAVHRFSIAAALRAAVEQCVYTDDFGWEHMDPEDVLEIANELDGGAAT
jgi:hypothetical protein